jgi:hypothetical protein
MPTGGSELRGFSVSQEARASGDLLPWSRLKFRQHPELAAKLVATGDARIRGIGFTGRYWDEGGSRGRNWLGRILEMVRSELILRQDGRGLSSLP